MSQAQKIQAVLAAPESAHRTQLIALVFDGLSARKVGDTIDRALLIEGIYQGLRASTADTIASRHVLPALDRIAAALHGKEDRLRDLIGSEAEQQITALVQTGKGPRFGWLKNVVDPDDIRQLIAPVIQQLLFAFVNKLPIPGMGGAGSGPATSEKKPRGMSGLVGAIGKQVSRSIGDLADVGRGVMGNVVKDFSQTATSEFRVALRDRMKTPEGQKIVERIRDRVVSNVLQAKADSVVKDFMHLPRPEIARAVALSIEHLRTQPVFRALLEAELNAVLDELAQRTVGELLTEVGVLEATRKQVLTAVDPVLKDVVAADSFVQWLDGVLADAQ
ncbi:MAG TPA: hypothetical protein VFX59_16620 [Polyangiales bacterium]|nr:hypothetical protein [Polyangiales bacterium]